ncbi:pentatricopeptide repeat-containing protein At3g16610-like [Andrographis paniculata]|uniref:pentatricopeptide repeat-containing protein At3g16610-like n=1 Tax=Andrographis paniculata TaxID=175694 RepID=UPI0021E70A90|nr:pentatricopeptide repeat-containing protein At3g16610-like [Andrographis paniculata]XP_051131479.1 pentatricopeptide repeat-containing protein At3g16610-like [Andrographis paniculata]XP_051131480.1 pentatricopeptide repeat-containing protein At3g16610-like [Andrographis paniculata]
MRFRASSSLVNICWNLNHQNVQTPRHKPFMLASIAGFMSQRSCNQCLSTLLAKSLPPNTRLYKARSLLGVLLVEGILNAGSDITPPASSLASNLVQVFAQLGCPEEALLVFDRFHCIDNISCNAIMRAYVDAAQFSQAIQFFDDLVFKLCIVPDNYTWPLILKACSGLCALEKGREVHDLIRSFESRHCLKVNAYTKCALIDMFAKCGSLDEAHKIFDDMPRKERDLASWTAIICGTVHHGKWSAAVCLFRNMRLEGLRPDPVVVAAILPACGRTEARHAGMSLQGCAVKSGFHHDLVVSNAVMDMYCKLGNVDQAYGMFCKMLNKDVISWSTLIAGYSQNCQHWRSIELYREMLNLGVKPSVVIVSSILQTLGKLNLFEQGMAMHGFILKQGFDFDVVVGCALIFMYSSCGSIGDLNMLLSNWSDRDIMIWNSAIAGHASYGNSDAALNTFRDLWKAGVKLNSITLMSILPICTKMGALKQGMEVHCHVLRSNLAISVSVDNALIDMYCKCGYLHYGLMIFDHMMEKDVVSYNTMISAYGFHGFGKQALILFDEMKSSAMQPTKATFVGLLSACSHTGLVQQGSSLYSSMINDYGIVPNMEHYSCMVDLLGRAGRIHDACDFIRRMPEEPDGNVLGCLLAACRIHNMMEPMDALAEEILQSQLEDTGYHILLSNLYASTKKWKDSSRVRALIKEKGLRKKPGMSWIQTGHCTHVFDARDTTHREFHKIQHILGILSLDMKEIYAVDPCLSAPSL